MLKRYAWLLLVLAFSANLLASTETRAASQSLENQRESLFRQMLADPTNLEIAFQYAALSVRVGDLEGAVSTVERLLIFAPDNARLKLELGILYYRLGNFQTAKYRLEGALATGGLDAPSIATANKYLSRVENQLKPVRWQFRSLTGIRWQSNANYAPTANFITLNNGLFNLLPGGQRKSDFSIVDNSRGHLEIDLGTQGDRFEVDLVSFGSFQFGLSSLSTNAAELTFGPSANLGRFGIDNTYASIYGIANGAMLDLRGYFGTLGVGSRIVARPSDMVEFLVKAEWRHRGYRNSAKRPNQKNRNGNAFRLVARTYMKATDQMQFSFGGHLVRKDLRAAFFDRWEYGVSVTAATPIEQFNPFKAGAVIAHLGAGVIFRKFDTPDPAVNATVRQKDTEFWVRGSLEVPVRDHWALVPRLEYRRAASNYPLSKFGAFTAMIAVQYKK